MYNIIIVGAGGFGREVYLWAKDSFSQGQYKIKGFLDDNPRILDNYDMDVGIIGNLNSYKIKNKDRFLFAIGDIDTKKHIVVNLKKKCAQIGDFVMMNLYSTCGHDVKIGKYCILSPYAILNGFVTLKDEVFLGTHSTVIPYKKVGYKSKISANSVVMRDVATNKIVFGVPGKAI
jgi:acetyltransferase-like isoleucine patch superfamily enzyme